MGDALAATGEVPGYVVGTWDVGPNSSVQFSVRHMLVSTTRGRFNRFQAVIVTAPDPARCSVEATIETASLDTNDAARDEAVRGPEWLDVQAFPTMTFRSTDLERGPGGGFRLQGDLTLKGVTHPVALGCELGGFIELPSGRIVAGFTAHGEIDRLRFGVGSEAALGPGGLLVGRTIVLDMELEAVLRRP